MVNCHSAGRPGKTSKFTPYDQTLPMKFSSTESDRVLHSTEQLKNAYINMQMQQAYEKYAVIHIAQRNREELRTGTIIVMTRARGGGEFDENGLPRCSCGV